MYEPRDFEDFARSMARDTLRDVLNPNSIWTSQLGIKRASVSQQLVGLSINMFALDYALRRIDDVSEDKKQAFAAGFLQAVEQKITSKGIPLTDFHNTMRHCFQVWQAAHGQGTDDVSARVRIGLEMAKSLYPEAMIDSGTIINSIFSATVLSYARAVRVLSSVEKPASSPPTAVPSAGGRRSATGCLIFIVGGIAAVLLLV